MPVFVEQEALLTLLAESRSITLEALGPVDLDRAVADCPGIPGADGARRGRDLLARLAAWEREIANALRASAASEFPAGGSDQAACERAAPDAAAVRADWLAARAELREAVAALAWPLYGRRIPVGRLGDQAGGAEDLFLGEIVKRVIGLEQASIRAILAAASLANPYDGDRAG